MTTPSRSSSALGPPSVSPRLARITTAGFISAIALVVLAEGQPLVAAACLPLIARAAILTFQIRDRHVLVRNLFRTSIIDIENVADFSVRWRRYDGPVLSVNRTDGGRTLVNAFPITVIPVYGERRFITVHNLNRWLQTTR